MTGRPPTRTAIVGRLRAAGCVFAEEEADLLLAAATTPAELSTMVDRRVSGQPLETIVGWVEFCGRRVAVAPGVFVPRRRTELLVRTAVALAPAGATVVDLACGCGAIGLAIADQVPGCALYAVDIEPAAVRCAQGNLPGAQVYQGDLFAPLPAGLRIDVLVANVPYVPSGAVGLLPPEARRYEPRLALDGGPDGLDVLRRVAAEAPRWLAPGGHVLMETGAGQVAAALAALVASGLTARVVEDQEVGATVVAGCRPALRSVA